MSIAARIDMAAERAGFRSMAALARACGVTPPSITALANGSRPMTDLLNKISEMTNVSANWLRTGDPLVAPPWVDQKTAIITAAQGLSPEKRGELRLELEAMLDAADHDDQAIAIKYKKLIEDHRQLRYRYDQLKQRIADLLEDDPPKGTIDEQVRGNSLAIRDRHAAAKKTHYDQDPARPTGTAGKRS